MIIKVFNVVMYFTFMNSFSQHPMTEIVPLQNRKRTRLSLAQGHKKLAEGVFEQNTRV